MDRLNRCDFVRATANSVAFYMPKHVFLVTTCLGWHGLETAATHLQRWCNSGESSVHGLRAVGRWVHSHRGVSFLVIPGK